MTETRLHKAQEKLIEILSKNIDEPLTVRELQEMIGASSTSVVVHHMAQLEKKGYLKKNPYNSKDYQILKRPDKEIAYLNLYGLAACGPSGSILDGSPIDRVPVSTKFLSFSASKAFMVKAKGDSMLPKINSGDFVIIEQSNKSENGVIALCVNDGQALIKKIKQQNKKDKIILVSLNSDFEPFLAAEDFRVEGVVRGVISNKMF
ncbi:MAG: peptidase S24 [Proteobacteria bacterium]|nr:peptidase S24 [Pseudomonadota bacterium]